jgi:pilus assembly protein CpaB
VTTTNVQAGQLLLASMFGDPGETSLAASVKKNMRAITVRVNDVIGVAGFLLPGSRVDVIATISRLATGVAMSRTILSDIKVLAVDQTTATKSDEPVMVRAVTLEVTPKQAETLLKGQAAGSIQLTLRNPSDHGDSVDLAGPVRTPTGHLLRRAPPPVRPVIVIRGTEVAHAARRE